MARKHSRDDTETVKATLMLPIEVAEKVRKIAERDDRSVSWVVSALVVQALRDGT